MFAGITTFLAHSEFEEDQKHIYAQEHQLYYNSSSFKGQLDGKHFSNVLYRLKIHFSPDKIDHFRPQNTLQSSLKVL